MAHGQQLSGENLTTRTIAAHRAYLDALVVWEHALHAVSCDLCRPHGASTESLAQIAEQAEAEKERRRTAFRDLSAELGYVPTGEGGALPEQEAGCPSQACASPAVRPS